MHRRNPRIGDHHDHSNKAGEEVKDGRRCEGDVGDVNGQTGSKRGINPKIKGGGVSNLIRRHCKRDHVLEGVVPRFPGLIVDDVVPAVGLVDVDFALHYVHIAVCQSRAIQHSHTPIVTLCCSRITSQAHEEDRHYVV